MPPSPCLTLDYLHAVNLAVQQNALPVVRELRIECPSAAGAGNLHNLRCVISSSPEIFHEKTLHISSLLAGEEVAICDPELPLNYALLSALSDSVAGTLCVELFSENGTSLAREKFDIDICAPDQWLGTGIMPELLAAFVTPNLEIISKIMSRVATELEKATGSPAIQGYQADKTRVFEICVAIYRAIQSFGIGYSNPPATFSAPGQKIRFPDTICAYRLGTCLDLALLFASVMEQCGLHPVILMHKGHAYVGCHLVKRYFHDIPMDDLQTIRKLVEIDEFVVIETTLVCENSPFSEAENHARTKNLNVDEGDFQCAIDVVRARYSGIRPLPIVRSSGGFELDPLLEKTPADAPHRKLHAGIELSEEKSRERDRIDRWKQKLLDLSLRNRLLNARDNGVIPLVCADITQLEDKVAANQTMAVKPISELLGEKDDLRHISQRQASEVRREIRPLLERELEQQRLWTLIPAKETARRLKALYRQSKIDIEEGGVNTLFLAIGFLEWKTSASDKESRLAPLLLLPVRMQMRSLAEGFTISRIDEDTLVNTTLLELLRQEHHLDVPGLDPLPTDSSGVDVGRVLQIFRRAILPLSGWEVREEASLGSFSFGKFNMWNDLAHRADALRAHPLIRHLIDGGGLFDDGVEVFPPEKIGEHLDPATLFCPMNADSSQLTAVRYSELGKSFVLHGPPGTGKSQTITNIIAHNLALGRRVLFVSEKKAALDVVHRRLCAVGLRPFCLELHSNKTGKTEALKQFSEALAVPDAEPPAGWEATVDALERSRDELNGYVNELHREYPNGLSAYSCLSRLFAETNPSGNEQRGADSVPANAGLPGGESLFPVETNCLAQSREALAALRQTAADLSSAFAGTTAGARDAFRDFLPLAWTPLLEKTLGAEAEKALAEAQNFQKTLPPLCALLNVQEEETRPAGSGSPDARGTVPAEKWVEFAKILASSPNVPAAFFEGGENEFAQAEKFLSQFLLDFSRREKAAKKLTNFRLERLPALDCDDIERRLRKNETKFFLARTLSNRALLRELAGIKKLGSVRLSIEELTFGLGKIREFCSAEAAVASALPKAKALLGELWDSAKDAPDQTALSAALKAAKRLRAEIRALARNQSTPAERLLARCAEILPCAKTFFAEKTLSRSRVDEAAEALARFQQTNTDFAKKFAPKFAETPLVPAEQIRRLGAVLRHVPALRRTLRWVKKRAEAEACGLGAAVRALEQGRVSAENFTHAVETEYRRTMLSQVLVAVPALGNFVGEDRDAEIRRFRTLDDRHLELSQKIIFARLAARLPKRDSGERGGGRRRTVSKGENAELGLLRRECEKRTRQKPVRQLLATLPTLVSTLKPCFLMSPLSVAQYLSPEFTAGAGAFDLVVFDEASQIPVWDAIGVIARGRQLIVVGDPKQMPPTAFFQKTLDADFDESDDASAGTATAALGNAGEWQGSEETLAGTVDDDAESILDECIAAGVYSAHLNWHYRSRHESLISFSNRHYYENRLLTFPSAHGGRGLGVRFSFVENGVYARRGKRTNRAEAEALVSEIFARLGDPSQREKSFGVVAFSEAQKNIIEDLIEKKRPLHPEADSFFSEERAEPFFVKNLENVQGDERDVIFFSIGYAPDEKGVFSMNFGPLNRQGGERRLNVAITRAKEQIVVFSSIHGGQIDLERTHATGAAHLKYFLEYAERGVRITSGGNAEQGAEPDGLADEIAALLTARGYPVRRDVGRSAGRIDVAVAQRAGRAFAPPSARGNADDFLLGIECDGPSYRTQRTARDRDHLRDDVLKSLGWNIFHAWSLDWAFDRPTAENALFEALAAAEKRAEAATIATRT